jgi:hypothetical protein
VPADTLYLRAGELVNAAASLLPGITRAYVAPALPALDCADQLTVHILSVGRQSLSAPALAEFETGLGTTMGAVNIATYVVTVVRCVPSGPTPPTTAYEEASQLLLSDIWLLWKGIPGLVRSGELWEGCEQLTLGPATAIPESGSFAGWQLPVVGEVFSD